MVPLQIDLANGRDGTCLVACQSPGRARHPV